MFLAIIAGYLVAALFAFCGVYNVATFLTHLDRGAGADVFVNGTALAAWPLAVAAVVYILTRIAILIENQGIILTDATTADHSDTSPVPAQPKRPAAPRPLPTGSYFHAIPVTQPQEPATNGGRPTATASLDEVADIAATAAKEAEQEAAEPSEKLPPVIKRREDGLSFFRVD